MKSVKPGRGPSAMGAMGSAFTVIFGLFWTISAINMGAPIMFPVFGVFFIIMGIVQALYHYKNATGENRFSVLDIVDGGEESDPFEQKFGNTDGKAMATDDGQGFCPYCGAKTYSDYVFCSECGRKLA